MPAAAPSGDKFSIKINCYMYDSFRVRRRSTQSIGSLSTAPNARSLRRAVIEFVLLPRARRAVRCGGGGRRGTADAGGSKASGPASGRVEIVSLHDVSDGDALENQLCDAVAGSN